MSFERNVEADPQDAESRRRAIIEKKRQHGNVFVCPNCFHIDDYEIAKVSGDRPLFLFESDDPERIIANWASYGYNNNHNNNNDYIIAKYAYTNYACRCNNCKSVSTHIMKVCCGHEFENMLCKKRITNDICVFHQYEKDTRENRCGGYRRVGGELKRCTRATDHSRYCSVEGRRCVFGE